MGNAIGSFFSGFSQVVGKIFGHPLDFLSGKSCKQLQFLLILHAAQYVVQHGISNVTLKTSVSRICSSSPWWQYYFTLVMLLFLYLVYKLGICQCICHIICRTIWACCATYFSALDFCCTYICYKLRTVKRKRRRRKRDIEAASSTSEQEEYELGEISKQPRKLELARSLSNRRSYKDERLRRSLRPTSHRAHVEFSRDSTHRHRKKTLKNIGDHNSPLHHHIRVARSSRFSHKRSRHRSGINHKRR
ncbi:hypothetical protein BUALT_Bualt08G0117400 [Buddleja alternifolia]|uniref:Uncharacterized protein n=1 Tax=Buddleja alternifolia TaxID=168488 RepID=A0AAV6X6T8_9LAMI|nr:hypothetical protein BUALT_Bualt08G0117400 [Buddleja alternifolia]